MIDKEALTGLLLDAESPMTLGELCRCCGVHAEFVVELMEEGVLEPLGRDPLHPRFRASSLRRVNRALRLRRDLGVNLAGIALALELMEQIDHLHARLSLLEPRD